MPQELTILERADLQRLKKRVDKAVESWQDGVAALIEIRDRKLYRAETNNFEQFCQNNWGHTRRWADQLIAALGAIRTVTEKVRTGVLTLPAARELSKVPEGQRAEVVENIIKSGQTVTPEAIVKQTHPPIPAPNVKQSLEILRDPHGVPIPSEAAPYWARKQEVQDLLGAISKIKTTLLRYEKEQDNLLGWVAQHTLKDLALVYTNIANAMPHTVCTECEGTPSLRQCSFCHGTGLISKWRYDLQAAAEKKEIRLKAYGRFAS